MKLIFIRHAEPDYENNTLTKKGFKEAGLLANYLKNNYFDEIYVSPLNRARLTFEAIARKNKHIHKSKIEIKPWMEEFIYSWDFLPTYFTKNNLFYDKDNFLAQEKLNNKEIKDQYKEAIHEFDKILQNNGYKRENNYYKVNEENEKTLLFVSHLGLGNVLIGHLLNIPYPLLCQVFFQAPSSLTILVSEEREKGIAQFRVHRYGDVTHLLIKKEEVSKAGSFCEIFNSNDRH